MFMHKVFTGLLFLTITFAFSQDVLQLSEENLKQYVNEENINVLNSAIQNNQASVNQQEHMDQYTPSLFGKFSYLKTNEEPFISFQPVVSPQSVLEVGVQKKIPLGMNVEAKVNFDNREFDLGTGVVKPSIATTSIALNIDLWKNFLGKLDQANLNQLGLNQKQTQLQERINLTQQLLTLRSYFWNLSAFDEQIKIAQSMAGLAEKQLKNAQQRYNLSAADLAEVSFYRSQVSSRKYEVLRLKFKREQVFENFKRIIPAFSKYQDIEILGVDASQTRQKVLECVANIQNSNTLPKDQTLYDELISLVQDYYGNEKKIQDTYGGVDVQLNASVFTRAVDSSATVALDESFTENRQGYEASLNVNVPFGKSKTRRDKLKLNEKKLKSELLQIEQNMSSTYQTVKKSSYLLLESIEYQKDNLKNLKLRSREILRKFNQGRISISDYMSDQDRLLQTELQLVDSQNLIIQTLLQYLSVFTQSPCAFNQVVS